MKRNVRVRKKNRVRKGVSGRGRRRGGERERCEVNREITLEVKSAEMFKSPHEDACVSVPNPSYNQCLH